MATLFISDLHLAPERPAQLDEFATFTRDVAAGADALYVLGDLFEYWLGDDDMDGPFHRGIADALKRVSARGTPVYFMRGNRDVLVGSAFAERCGAAIVQDPTLVDLYGTPTLLMHGDTLCTDDLEYQKFRSYAHDPQNQARFLAQPLAARRDQMMNWRKDSESGKQGKTAEIMDVAPTAVEAVLREHGYPRLIHGHTHRPGKHVHRIDDRDCERWVLNDWYVKGGYLRCDRSGCELVRLRDEA
jgi:UDP-2,3-diacylglucosamine hydrolase